MVRSGEVVVSERVPEDARSKAMGHSPEGLTFTAAGNVAVVTGRMVKPKEV